MMCSESVPARTKAAIMPKFNPPRPSFDDPPVIEVVLGMQFEPLAALQVAHYGLFWQGIRDGYPITETKPPLDPLMESFSSDRAAEVRFEVIQGFPDARVWFSNRTETELIQLQKDRFLFNWRKHDEHPYPRYEHVRARFEEQSARFMRFLAAHELGHIVPLHCEVTYINHVALGGPFTDFGALHAVFAHWSGKNSDSFLPEPEQATFNMSYRLVGEDNKPFGRLHVSAEPRLRVKDKQRILQISMTARGVPLGEGMAGVFEFLDVGREYVVRGFTSLTTAEMHKVWGRDDAK